MKTGKKIVSSENYLPESKKNKQLNKGKKKYPRQSKHICKAHKADTQKPTLQKSLPCAYASGHTLLRWTHAFNSKHQDEGRTQTQGGLLCWLTNIFSASYRYQPISSRRNSISFCCYLHHQFFNQQRLRAGHYKIPAQQKACLL